MKEKVLEAFSELGFVLEDADGMGYRFDYEGLNMVYLCSDNDEDFLNIAVPGIIETNDDNVLHTCAMMEKINSTLKYVKAYWYGKNVWLFYERELIGEEDLPMVISSMIMHLESSICFVEKVKADVEKMMADYSDDSDDDGSEETSVEEITETDDNE